MTVPITGAFILVMGGCFFFFSPRLLYSAMIVAIPFTATAVVNLQEGGEEKGVMAWLFLGALWVLREVISGVPPWRKTGWLRTRHTRYALIAFLFVVGASLCVPFIENGTTWVPVMDALSTGIVSQPVKLSSYDITQTIYLSFGILLTILVAAENCATDRLLRTVKLYISSCGFLAAWGILQLWCDLTGHAYPSFIFNNSLTKTALGYKQTIAVGGGSITRISSGALEPSVLASELLIAFVILLVCKKLGKPLISRKLDNINLALITATLILSTSTTAYAGMALALVIAGAALVRAGRSARAYFVLPGLGIIAGVVAVVIVPLVSRVAAVVGPNKLEEFSGLQRFGSIPLAARVFLMRPIFGAGWHTVICWDWVFLILANVGLAGFLTFVWFLYPVLRGLWISAGAGSYAGAALLSAVVFLLALAEMGVGLEYAAGYDWLFLGLGASAVALDRVKSPLLYRRVGDLRALTPPQIEPSL